MVLLTQETDIKPHCPRCGVVCRLQIKGATPDVIYHLAALSSVSNAEQDPRAVLKTNFGGTLALLQAMLQTAPTCKLVFISSSEVYGRVAPEDAVLKANTHTGRILAMSIRGDSPANPLSIKHDHQSKNSR